MVYETRKVVEDYVLYKIHQYLMSTKTSTSHVHQLTNGNVQSNGSSANYLQQPDKVFPPPQEPPSKVNAAVRSIATDYNERFKATFTDLLDSVRASHITTNDIDVVLGKVSQNLFRMDGTGRRSTKSSPVNSRKTKVPSPNNLVEVDSAQELNGIEYFDDSHIKWGHVIALLVFAGTLAVRSIEVNKSEQVDKIVDWVSNFFDTTLRYWLKRQGGWSNIVEWQASGSSSYPGAWLDSLQIKDSVSMAVKVTVIAAVVGLGAMVMTRK